MAARASGEKGGGGEGDKGGSSGHSNGSDSSSYGWLGEAPWACNIFTVFASTLLLILEIALWVSPILQMGKMRSRQETEACLIHFTLLSSFRPFSCSLQSTWSVSDR